MGGKYSFGRKTELDCWY